MVKIDFEVETKHGVYRDAILLPNDHSYSSDEIEKMKRGRVDNWIYVVENPPMLEGESDISTTQTTDNTE